MTTTVLDRYGSQPEPDAELPALDEYGLLRYRGHWVAVSSTEERVLRPLLGSWRHLVGSQQLVETVWPTTKVKANAIHTLVRRLRRRLQPLGLTVETIRARGFLMEPLPEDDYIHAVAAGQGRAAHEGSTWPIS
jgi:DNA-binding winged helix-turn-helix (wHTH) protein